jgi:hypothetical protein
MPRKNSYNPSEHVRKVILAATRASPGIRSDALAKETSLHGTTISSAARVLIGQGLLTRVRKGPFYYYYPPGAEVAPEPQQLFLSSEPLLEAEIEALKAEIAELRAFKDRALGQYPDLGVDPLVLVAREIAIELMPQEREAINLGRYDSQPEVLGPLLALRRAEGIS